MNRVLSLESFRHNDVVSFVNWKQIDHFQILTAGLDLA